MVFLTENDRFEKNLKIKRFLIVLEKGLKALILPHDISEGVCIHRYYEPSTKLLFRLF